MAASRQASLWVFRDTSESAATGDLVRRLTALLELLAADPNRGTQLDALLPAERGVCTI